MKKVVLFVIFMLMFQSGIGQGKDENVDIVSHEVKLGETVRLISKKYLVNPAEIYKLNKFATDGISPGMILRIPVPHKEPVARDEQPPAETAQETPPQNDQAQEQPVAETPPPAKHKKEKAPVKEAVAETPPPAAEKPEAAQPAEPKSAPVPTETASAPAGDHTVQSGETLYSLARQYNVTVNQIKDANPETKKGLRIGQVIHIPGGSSMPSAGDVQAAPSFEKPQSATASSAGVSSDAAVTHEVKPGETLFGLAKKYHISVDELKAQNPDLEKRGLQMGQKLTIKKTN